MGIVALFVGFLALAEEGDPIEDSHNSTRFTIQEEGDSTGGFDRGWRSAGSVRGVATATSPN
jgi:hypothetical protein